MAVRNELVDTLNDIESLVSTMAVVFGFDASLIIDKLGRCKELATDKNN